MKMVLVALSAGTLLGVHVPAEAGPAETCARVGTSDIVRSLGTGRYYRCLAHKALVCSVGANLPCAKIRGARRNPGADAYCRRNPSSSVVPMVATGHDARYTYRCKGSRAVADGQTWQIDARGFARGLWTPLH